MLYHDQSGMRNILPRSSSNRISKQFRYSKAIRELIAVILALLFVQFLLGMWTNLFVIFSSPLPSVNPLELVFVVGPYILTAHILTGLRLGIMSTVVLVLSAMAKKRSTLVLAIAGLGSILLAGESVIEFVLGWYSNDALSFLMSLGFVLSFAIYSLSLLLNWEVLAN